MKNNTEHYQLNYEALRWQKEENERRRTENVGLWAVAALLTVATAILYLMAHGV